MHKAGGDTLLSYRCLQGFAIVVGLGRQVFRESGEAGPIPTK